MKTIRFMLCLNLLLGSLSEAPLHAQTPIAVKEAKGECFIVNISPEKAKETALFYAKLDALKKAGIPEDITGMFNYNGEQFLEISNIEIGGNVTDFEIVSSDINVLQAGPSKIMVAEVLINASVLKYEKARDLSFQFKVQGIRDSYRENDNLSFSVTPYQNGYLRIFLFEEDGLGEQIYPDNLLEPDLLFSREGTINFPLNDAYRYQLVKTDRSKSKETNRMLFVYLKDNIRFIEKEVTLQVVLNWVAKISPERRTEMFYQFTINR
ncbi:MAG: DUF4384 domain-containing protein [Tannerellaceae bacterium]|jgi:hypothetical protein|nr:DUF4384 domain-containing protein [Tannerellaceae bacterium]